MAALHGLVTKFISANLSFAVDTLRAEIQSLGHQLGGRFDSLDLRVDGIDIDV